jgi:hypothetical protein
VLVASLLFVLVTQQPTACADVEVCRAEALIAHAKKDFEAFHDLAWAAYNKGRKNDTELMLLVARAQSLSGRPGDALVMLERIAALGGAADAATSEDFSRVRALERWPEVEARLSGKSEPAKSEPTKFEPTKAESPKPEPAKAELAKPKPETSKPEKSEPAKRDPPKPESPKPDPAKPEPTTAEPKKTGAGRAPRAPGAPLKFTTLLTPSALAYDAVSKRFIIADRDARRVAVIDENTGQVSTLVGAQAALGDVGGIAIDARQGDLWIVSAGENGSTLHKMQLISGRMLQSSALKGIDERIVGMTFVRDAGLVAADAGGNLWRVGPSGRSEKIGAFEYVPRALASDPLGRLYVSAGGPRLARYSITTGLRRLGAVELEKGIPADTAFVVSADRLHAIVAASGEYEIRSMRIDR